MQKQEQNKGHGWLVLLKVWSVTLYLPLRRGMGRDHLGFSLLFGYLLIFVIAEYARAPSLMWLFAVDLIAWLIGRVKQEVRYWRGIREHTEYGGDSVLEGIFGDYGAKQFGEPLLSFFVGWLIYNFSPEPNAASYFWYGGVVMALFQASGAMERRRIEDQIHNAKLENQYHMAKLRRRL